MYTNKKFVFPLQHINTTALAIDEPSENSLEIQMASFLNRIQTQKSKIHLNGKTISNISE